MGTSLQLPPSKRKRIGLQWFYVVLGIWLLLAPRVLDYVYVLSGVPRWNDLVVGLLVTFLALACMGEYRRRVWNWGNILAGPWLIAAPFLLDYNHFDPALWNDTLVGVGFALLAWAGTRPRRPRLAR